MTPDFQQYLTDQLDSLRSQGLFKSERLLESPQSPHMTANGKSVLNLCANNYLGLADHPLVIAAAKKALDTWGYGLASVRFICGTQTPHKTLETALTQFLGTDDTILYSSCWDANGGLFEILLDEHDAVISDELNHASIIDGIRLCKAQRLRYKNNNMADLETRLREATAAKTRFRLIATDGVFSMDGSIANLPDICTLADKYQALIMVDDSHAVGVLGQTGRGTPEHHGLMGGRIDILTGTLGKALGGASGGYTSARKEIVALLRQRSRPYLFSNTLPPPVVAGALAALNLLTTTPALLTRLRDNAAFFRQALQNAGFTLLPGQHPIIPIMLGDASLATRMAEALLARGIYVIGFSFPVVPQGKARIRTQLSAAHTKEDLTFAAEQFAAVKRELSP